MNGITKSTRVSKRVKRYTYVEEHDKFNIESKISKLLEIEDFKLTCDIFKNNLCIEYYYLKNEKVKTLFKQYFNMEVSANEYSLFDYGERFATELIKQVTKFKNVEKILYIEKDAKLLIFRK